VVASQAQKIVNVFKRVKDPSLPGSDEIDKNYITHYNFSNGFLVITESETYAVLNVCARTGNETELLSLFELLKTKGVDWKQESRCLNSLVNLYVHNGDEAKVSSILFLFLLTL